MKTRIFKDRDLIGRFSCTGERLNWKQRLALRMKRAITIAAMFQIAIWSGMGLYELGKMNAPIIVKAQVETVEVMVEGEYPVMKRIAKCESGDTHYRNGQVIFNANTNKTVDIGRYQINSIWSKKATEMGLDLTKESDNEKFALYLYKNFGTEHWYSSKACWSR